MYPNSETFELFYNENVADKWIPNLFGKNPFQSNGCAHLVETNIQENLMFQAGKILLSVIFLNLYKKLYA